MKKCVFAEQKCLKCSDVVKKCEMVNHLQILCPYRPETCLHCGRLIPYAGLEVSFYFEKGLTKKVIMVNII